MRAPENGRAYEDVGGGDDAELEVLGGALLQLGVGAAQVVVGAEDVLDLRLDLRKEVDELDVRRQQQRPRRRRAQVVLFRANFSNSIPTLFLFAKNQKNKVKKRQDWASFPNDQRPIRTNQDLIRNQ